MSPNPDADADENGDAGGDDADTDDDAAVFPWPCEPVLFWRTEFLVDPTTRDDNGDGVPDWVLRDGSPFPVDTIDAGLWSTNDLTLDTSPHRSFGPHMIAEARFRALGTPGEAQAWLWAGHDPSDQTAVLIHADLSRRSGGQHLEVVAYQTDTPILSRDLDTEGLVTVRLEVDTIAGEAVITVDGERLGAFPVPRSDVGTNEPKSSLWSTTDAEYDWFWVVECRT